MRVIDDLLRAVPEDVPVCEVRVGAFWTAVVVGSEGRWRCGLASTLHDDHGHGRPAVREAGNLSAYRPRELAELARSESPIEASIGMAAINALISVKDRAWPDINADEVIARHGAGKRVALVGHFPFIPWLREQVGQLTVLELRPRGDDRPASAAAEVIPEADVLAITATTLINHTFQGLMDLRRPDALVLMLGPSTPLSPILFDHGVHLLSGSLVEDVDAVLRAVSQGANFRQVHRAGVRLVTIMRDDLPI